ncbi:hypothetical protein [uncultured Mucilaginibacter sp.]|uniref:hypothetical protein n=1 Tax=uncultured Mucilaginibacter sp. TaxID=797541 RepID=UPI0025E2E172|nr:hypothetical protein [uncultured Mucilaginibacter sp.]
MARTVAEIQTGIFDSITSDGNLSGLTSTSKVAIFRLFVYVVAFAIWTLELLFDTHYAEVQTVIQQDKAHTPSWYRTKALAFQYGFALIPDTDVYDNTGYTADQVLASQIIKYSAVTSNGGQILIKTATETAGVLAPITTGQKASLDAYFKEISDCGVKYIVVNNLPDILLLTMHIFIDPLVLLADGMSILNGNYPVQDTINAYMKLLPFNGELVLAHLVDALQQAEGVNIPNIINAESQVIDINTGTYLAAQVIDVRTIPDAGYFMIPNFDNITYVV